MDPFVVANLAEQVAQGGVDQAMARQSANQKRFAAAFARGLVVTGFARDEKGNGYFELSRWSAPASTESSVGTNVPWNRQE